jgi:hypothetical protein
MHDEPFGRRQAIPIRHGTHLLQALHAVSRAEPEGALRETFGPLEACPLPRIDDSSSSPPLGSSSQALKLSPSKVSVRKG